MTQPELALNFPPVDVVRRLENMLDAENPQLILDAGVGTGRNERFLRGLGHTVVSLSNQMEELRSVHDLAQKLDLAGKGVSVLGDVSSLPFQEVFDVALINEVTHLLPKYQTFEALENLRRVTKPGGLNVVSGYLIEPGKANIKNSTRCFHPGELPDIYVSSGWKVLFYEEDRKPPTYIKQGAMRQEFIHARSKLIARRSLA